MMKEKLFLLKLTPIPWVTLSTEVRFSFGEKLSVENYFFECQSRVAVREGGSIGLLYSDFHISQ